MDSGGSLRVSLIGHSFIRLLRDFMSHNSDTHNLRLDNGYYQVLSSVMFDHGWSYNNLTQLLTPVYIVSFTTGLGILTN